MDILVIIFGIASIWMFAAIGKTELERKNNLKDLEVRFLVTSAHFQQYRYQMLKILEIVYDKASEADEQFKKDYEKIITVIVAKNRDGRSGSFVLKYQGNITKFKEE